MGSSDSGSDVEAVTELDEAEQLNGLKAKKTEGGEGSGVNVESPSKMEMHEEKESDASEGSEKPSLFSSVRRFMGFERARNPLEDEKTEKGVLDVVEEEAEFVEKEIDEVPVEVEMGRIPGEEDVTTVVGGHIEFDISVMAGGLKEPVINPVANGHIEETPLFKPDPVFVEVQRGLLQSVSMKLWLVNVLQEGGIEEEQFIEMFKDYESQFSGYLDHREELLNCSRKIDSLERALRETRVYLEELKMKKTIETVSDEEYKVKARALEWDINHYEQEISRKMRESDFLEDITGVLSDEEVSNLQTMAEKCRWSMDNLDASKRVSPKTSTRVRDSLHRTLEFLETFRHLSF
jgi:hypothetical protein